MNATNGFCKYRAEIAPRLASREHAVVMPRRRGPAPSKAWLARSRDRVPPGRGGSTAETASFRGTRRMPSIDSGVAVNKSVTGNSSDGKTGIPVLAAISKRRILLAIRCLTPMPLPSYRCTQAQTFVRVDYFLVGS